MTIEVDTLHGGNVAFTDEMMEDLPKKEVKEEVKEKNKFQYKYEVKLKRVPRKIKHIAGIKLGKIGRVVQVLDDKTVMVDFWDTSPARLPVKSVNLELVRTKEEIEKNLEITPKQQHKVKKENMSKSPTGALRENKGKLPIHLVPTDSIKAMASVLDYGASRYEERNWEKGANFSVPYSSLMRHLTSFWEGEDLDGESGLPHMYHVLMNAAMLVRYYEKHKELDDRPKG